jgi:hypothetical protein
MQSSKWYPQVVFQVNLTIDFYFPLIKYPYLRWIDAPQTQNFEIWRSLEKTQESKKFEIIFGIFAKMLDGSNFDKRYLLGYSMTSFASKSSGKV